MVKGFSNYFIVGGSQHLPFLKLAHKLVVYMVLNLHHYI